MPSTRCEAIWESQMVKEQATQHERLRRRCHVVCQPHMLGYGGGRYLAVVCAGVHLDDICLTGVYLIMCTLYMGRASHKCVSRRHISFRGTSHRRTSVGIHLINVHLAGICHRRASHRRTSHSHDTVFFLPPRGAELLAMRMPPSQVCMEGTERDSCRAVKP